MSHLQYCVLTVIAVDDSLGSQSLFITGEKLGQIRATKEVCACVCMHLRCWMLLCREAF